MKKQTRRKFSSAFKAKVALEAVKNQKHWLSWPKKFDVNPVMISQWKAAFLENMSAAFDKGEIPGGAGRGRAGTVCPDRTIEGRK